MNATFHLGFNVHVDEKSHLRVDVDIREYTPALHVWLVAAECQRWRGEYLGEGRYEQGHKLGEPFVLNARAETIDAALRLLADTAVTQCTGGAD